MNNALPITLVKSLGLSSRDLAEIGGFSDSWARDLMRCKAKFQEDVIEALINIQDDVDVIIDSLVSQLLEDDEAVIWVYPTNAILRKYMPTWPGRGCAEGGFTGPHYIAALTAYEILRDEHGIETDVFMKT